MPIQPIGFHAAPAARTFNRSSCFGRLVRAVRAASLVIGKTGGFTPDGELLDDDVALNEVFSDDNEEEEEEDGKVPAEV